jgi:YD repeat-containing protein
MQAGRGCAVSNSRRSQSRASRARKLSVTAHYWPLLAALLIWGTGTAVGQSYSYHRSVAINHAQVPNTDQTNFPVLISGTYSYLATVANGGKVQSSSGYDIVFTTDAAGSSLLNFEIDTYNPATGAINAWVRIPNLSHSTDTVIYLQYGNASTTSSQQNPAGVWSDYLSVYHLGDGTTLGLADDGTANYGLTNNNSATAVAGKIAGGAHTNGSNQSLTHNTVSAYPSGSSPRSMSLWFRMTSNHAGTMAQYGNATVAGAGFQFYYTGSNLCLVRAGLVGICGAWTYDNNWHKLDGIIPSGASNTNQWLFYLDGASFGSPFSSGSFSTTTEQVALGSDSDVSGDFYAGDLDEFRLTGKVRSSDWIATEYNNLNSPSAFYAVGLENAPTITGLSQANGFVGLSLTVNGSGFGTSTGTVTFNGTSATVTSWSDASITVVVPGAGPIVVTNSSSLQSNSFSFGVYGFERAITIDHTKVPNTDLENFPVLISGVYSYLATVANGGKVQNSSGYDIIFTSDSGGANKFDHEIESYDPATGTINMWVRIPTLSHSTDTTIYVLYGNSAITTSQENKTGVWDADFKGVWHLNGSPLSAADSTSQGHNGTINGVTGTTGKIAGAGNFSGNSQDIQIGNMGAAPVKGTISMWVQAPSLTSYPNAFATGFGCGNTAIRFELSSSGNLGATIGDSACDVTGANFTTAFTANVWHHLAVTWDSSVEANSLTSYYDGAGIQTVTNTFWPANFDAVTIGLGYGSGRYWNGEIDEVRMSDTIRPAGWIAAEYSNQNSPSTFYLVGSENTVAVAVSPGTALLYGGQTQPFAAAVTGSPNTAVTWAISPTGVGSISSSGLYTAPATVSSQQTVTVTATSSADATKSASATVTLNPPISVSVAPSTITLVPSQTAQFTATLTNTSNSAVTWTISPAGIGTVSSTGVYTAPATISSSQAVTITATSVVDTTKSGSAALTLSPASGVFSYHRPITISHAQVPNTDQSNFPVLISGAYSYLATVANGGKVQSAGGYDIIFTTDAAGTVKLNHEIETYDPATGTVRFWVAVPTLSHTTDTVIYMHYGDSTITASQENKAGVWDSNYVGVWHLANGATLSAADSTGNQNNGTNNGATPTTGQIDGAAAFNGSNEFIGIGPLGTFSFSSSLTISAWVKPNSSSGVEKIMALTGSTGSVGGTSVYTFVANLNETNGKFVAETGKAHFSTDDATAPSAFTTGQWSYVSGTFDGSKVTLYVNGTSQATTLYSSAEELSFVNTNGWSIGKYVEDGTDQQWWNGSIDEVRVSSTVRLPDWIATEYNNQSSPSTFYSIGAEDTLSVSVTPATSALYAGQTQQFTAATTNAANPGVTWSISPSGTGTISSGGLYTAPSSISTQQTVTVTATSAQDNATTGSASLALYPTASVAVTPGSPTLYPAQTQQFSATVSNAPTQAVTWTISPAVGSISSSGLYTAAATISAQQTVTVTATSVAEPTQTGTATITLGQWAQAYGSRRAITISHTQVANTDQSNFPALISGTYSYLATVANGGEVQNANGYDIIFTSDAAGSTKLDHEIESYNPTSGAINFWVRIPALSHTADTVIYMQYGNSSISSSQENRTGVWDSNYQGVWHLTTLSDSTANNYTLAGYNGGNAPNTLAGGKIGGAMSFASASSQNAGISGPNSPNLQIAGSQTWEMWINSPSLASGLERGPSMFNSSSTDYVALYANAGALTFATSGVSSSTVVNSSVAPTNNAWFHVVGVYDATAAKHRIYVNGVKTEVSTTGSHTTQNNAMTLADASDYTSHQYSNDSLDEIRISNTARSADWIATEYNNQSSPSTFYTPGVENAPLILSLSPASGEPGTSVTIQGMSFGSSTGSVAFNGASATVSSWSSTSITAVVPNGATSGPVVVTSSSSVAGNGFPFTMLLPFISGLSPAYGPAGTSVTISGTSFGSSAGTVTFNGVSATTSSWSDTSITATAPSGAGMGNVIVANNGEQSNPVMFGAPLISSLSPAAGPTGTSVTINGASFGSTTGSVTFDGVSATVTSWSATSITATVPSGALSGPVVVTVSGVASNAVGFLVQEQTFTGTVSYSYDPLGRLVGAVAASGDAATYNYDAVGNILSITRTPSTQPTVLSFSPTSGPVGTQITISGSNFSATISSDTVKFNGTTATISSASTTQLVVTVPSGATTGTIAVTAPAGTATSATSFAVTSSSSKPSISSFTPSIVAAGGSVTISGSAFDATPANDRLIVNTTVAAVPTSVTSSSMVLAAPSVGSGRIYLSTPGGATVSSSDLFVVPSGNSLSQLSYTGRATVGSTTTVSITSSGSLGGYLLFDGVAGRSVTVTASSSSFTFCSFNIYNPGGVALTPSGASCAASSAGSMNGQVLPVNGTYTIQVHPDSGLTGSVNITVSDATNAFTRLTSGTPATLTTTVAGQAAQATFSAVGGQQATLQFSSNTFGSVTASVLNPDGSTLTSTTTSASSFSFPTLLLPQSGVYTVLITPSGTATGSIQVSLTVAGGASAVPSRPAGSTLNTSNALATSLAGLFVMNEGTGTTDNNLVDSQTAGFSGAAPPTWTADPSILFQGGASLNSYLNAGADLSFDQLTTGQMTVVAKVLVTTASASGIAEKNDGDLNSGFVFGVDNTGALRLTVEKDQANMQVGTVAGTILANQWIQVAVTWDGTTGTAAAAHLYLNGVEQTKALAVDGSGTIQYQNATAQPFRIGNASFDFPGSLSGRIAYLAVYKGRILSTTELGQLDAQLPIH